MQQGGTSDILALAEREEADAVTHAPDFNPSIWRPDAPLPLPPIPPMTTAPGAVRDHQAAARD
jgi:hypothetical protein